MPNKLVIIQEGESLPFSFDRAGASIDGWTCQIKVKQEPTDIPVIDRFIVSDNERSFVGFLTSTEMLQLENGLWYLVGILNNAETDEQEEILSRFQVTKQWPITSVVADVTFSPLAGRILFSDLITLSTVTADATIRFTTDGTEPTSNSPIFLAPFTLPLGMQTVKAFASKTRFRNSAVTDVNYNVLAGQVDPVTFSPPAGVIGDDAPITLSTITAGATIHFTTDGSTPTILSPIFTVPFTLAIGVKTVKAFAVRVDLLDSIETQAIYTVQDVVEPVTFSPAAGDILNTDPITLSTITSSATIHFTTDGSTPTIASPIFSSPFTLPEGVQTVKAFAVKAGLIDSIETQAIYTVTKLTVQPVTFSPPAGTISDTQLITLSTITSGATIHFTTDGSTPTTGSPIFTVPFTLPLGVQTVKAFAVKLDFFDSVETQAIYTVQEQVAPVTFAPPAGTISDVELITLSTVTPGSTIHFTTDGSAPTTGSPVFSVPFTLPIGNQTVRAFALKVGFIDSIETQAIYTVQDVVEPITFSPVAGPIFDNTLITLSTITPGATIHFTTDGSTPTTGSPVFSVPFTLPVGVQTVKAFGVKINFFDSIETQAIYTVTAAFSPLDISNIVFWVDANDESSVTESVGGVSVWADQSSNNFDLLQGQSTRRPFYNTTADPHFILFDGTSDLMDLNNTTFRGQPNTYFMVARAVDNVGTQDIFDSRVTNANRFFDDGGLWKMAANTEVSTGKSSNTNKSILTPIFNGSSSRFYVNGGSSNIFNPGTTFMSGFLLATATVPANFANYEFYDVLFYSRLLTLTELNDLGEFFADKHSLTWTTITA